MDFEILNELAEKMQELAQAKFALAKIEWLVEEIDPDRHRIIIAIAMNRQGGPDTEYPPGRQ